MSSEGYSLPDLDPALRWDEGGVLRVGSSRVSFDVIVEQYENGLTPEEMVSAYETLRLEDVYAAVTYYLRHRGQVQSYLERRIKDAVALREVIEAQRPPVTRKELRERRLAREKHHAATGQ